MTNFDTKEKIRAYWSQRSATFDDSFSHSILPGVELEAWMAFYAKLVPGENLEVLELGSGTGEISKVLRTLGHCVTGIDFSEAMLNRAKAKHAAYPQVRYILGDAENTHQNDDSFDLVTCRHVMFTLLDPGAALADWFRVTKPGGHLVIFDGNFIATRTRDRLAKRLLAGLDRISPRGEQYDPALKIAAQEIKSDLYFANGLSFEVLADMVRAAGYETVTKHSYDPIRRAQRKIAGPRDWLATFIGDRFVLHAQKR